jgi:hypothetical protein
MKNSRNEQSSGSRRRVVSQLISLLKGPTMRDIDINRKQSAGDFLSLI